MSSDQFYREFGPSNATVNNWVNEIKRGRTSTLDEPQSGRSKDATTPEFINKVHDMVLSNGKIEIAQNSTAVGHLS